MTFISHTLITTAGVQILHLQGYELYLAYIFGVLVDFDHIFKAHLYFSKNKFNKEKHYHWRTSLQEPVALLWILPLSIFINSTVPIIFFISHLSLDYLVSYNKLPFYPFSKYSTKGLFTNVSNITKEVLVMFIFSCINLLSL